MELIVSVGRIATENEVSMYIQLSSGSTKVVSNTLKFIQKHIAYLIGYLLWFSLNLFCTNRSKSHTCHAQFARISTKFGVWWMDIMCVNFALCQQWTNTDVINQLIWPMTMATALWFLSLPFSPIHGAAACKGRVGDTISYSEILNSINGNEYDSKGFYFFFRIRWWRLCLSIEEWKTTTEKRRNKLKHHLRFHTPNQVSCILFIKLIQCYVCIWCGTFTAHTHSAWFVSPFVMNFFAHWIVTFSQSILLNNTVLWLWYNTKRLCLNGADFWLFQLFK